MFGSRANFATIAVAGLVVLAPGTNSVRAQSEPSFKGKTITMLIGADPGGGTDAFGRLIVPYLRKYLPGEPNILVQNMPGANGITALNYFVRRTLPDGLTVSVGSISTIDPVVYRNLNSQYDPKAFRFIGGVGRGGSLFFISKAAAPRLLDKSAKPVVIGSELALPRPEMQPALWAIEYLGWNATWVTGYHGTSETMFALDRGEIDLTSTGNIFQIRDRLDSGELNAVNQTGSLRGGKAFGRPEFGDAPLFPNQMQGKIKDPAAQKAFDLWTALNAGDKYVALVPGTPDNILTAYRDAFAKVAADPAFLAQGEKISDGFAPMAPRDVEIVVRTLADSPAEAIDYTKALMRKQGLHVQ